MLRAAMTRPDAILLIGPTGSGKTPLGELLEQRGLAGRACRHFDFGDRMRRIVAAELAVPELTPAEQTFLAGVLERGVLLEDEHFPIAGKVLRAFLTEGARDRQATVILNGLPRHVGQADSVDAIVHVTGVIELTCTPQVVLERIRRDTGGDRSRRTDDTDTAVRAKLETFRLRTAPLLDHYRRREATIQTIEANADTTAEEVWCAIEART